MEYRIVEYADGTFEVKRKRFLFWRTARISEGYVVWEFNEYGSNKTRVATETEAVAVIDKDVVSRSEKWLKNRIVNIASGALHDANEK